MINGEVYRGAQGYAGEVSIYNYKEQDQFRCDSGRDCFIKRWEMDLGMVDEARDALAKDREKREKFLNQYSCALETLDLKTVFAAARAGDSLVELVLERAAKRLGIKIAYLVNLLNPQAVIIGGGIEEAGEKFLNTVTSTIKEWAFRETADNLKIIYSQLRENAVALGVASLVMRRIFAQLG